MRYWHILILLTIISFGCKENTPQKAADEYCECLTQQYSGKIDTSTAVSNCDSIIASHYEKLRIYEMGSTDTPGELDSAAKFHDKFMELMLKNCCNLVGNCSLINFRNSLLKYYTTYSFRYCIDPIDFTKKLIRSCNKSKIECKYKIEFQERLAASDSYLYYEIVIFNDPKCVDSVTKLTQEICVQKMSPPIMSCTKINDSTLLMFTYRNFDFEKIKSLLRENFSE